MSHQVCKVPKEGHFYAEVRALLCSGKSTFMLPRMRLSLFLCNKIWELQRKLKIL